MIDEFLKPLNQERTINDCQDSPTSSELCFQQLLNYDLLNIGSERLHYFPVDFQIPAVQIDTESEDHGFTLNVPEIKSEIDFDHYNALYQDLYPVEEEKQLNSNKDDEQLTNIIISSSSKNKILEQSVIITKEQQDQGEFTESNADIAMQEQKQVRFGRRHDEQISKIDTKNMCRSIKKKYQPKLQLITQQRTNKFEQGIYLANVNRKDVVLKTLVREIRKVYLKQFQEQSRYLSVARYRHQKYYLFAIKNFTEKLFFNTERIQNKPLNDAESFEPDFSDEIVFFFGSVFYPKKMVQVIEDEKSQKLVKTLNSSFFSTIQKIMHKTHYKPIKQWQIHRKISKKE
ncbi:UNKNOWN [Stylonychia lemnae]|uniref:Uncharacterized protein n=1 Tax=Stylonychia lemnae TaxID=5949 RepID=A0A078ATB4_STYLE|nr:UNKNOWN [Stylonychia lemnae]|eukprot:CDW85444.1 UNKNOWN [Stylonychia lemnae]